MITKNHIYIGVSIIGVLLIAFIYSPVKIPTFTPDTSLQDTLEVIRRQNELTRIAYRDSINILAEDRINSANQELLLREKTASYYIGLYEKSKNQDIDSVTARTHDFFTNWEIPEY
jgi:hypothetical protein